MPGVTVTSTLRVNTERGKARVCEMLLSFIFKHIYMYLYVSHLPPSEMLVVTPSFGLVDIALLGVGLNSS